MRIVIAAVGKLREEERALASRYVERVAAVGRPVALGPLEVREIAEGKAQARDVRLADEAARLLARSRTATHHILLDERGKAVNSAAFASLLGDLRDRGEAEVAFLIGGPDGHGAAARAAASATLSLGALTLPHGLARIVLAEQVYRAATILAGHPYHRA